MSEERSSLPGATGPAIVIAVAPTAADRVRITDAVGSAAPVLLVGSVREAVRLLQRDVSLAGTAEPEAVGRSGPGAAVDAVGLRSVVERVEPVEPEPSEPEHAVDFVIDSDARVVRCGDRLADLSPLEHDLLVSLHQAGGHIRTFAWLQKHVWHNDHQGSRSHVQSVVKRLRRKLGEIGSPVQIDGVRGVGLRLVADAVDRYLG
ncbi:winged helix-turn-helix domain-containing protein [Nocardioides sp. YIM 152315]|uniref:winged helix-turn-helix domain-containing protein n=1 Tax=Nocardioides sp. YIM 152315 TaxID=3031760 RepID=UPI0023DAAFE8|nr:winged helix-turn-helix domain-containing protein [Nocardioides sp. YIM 152315]MDF1604203.1 winged helix-turn-helix domain-containing protein [Nocardioides sp. YIM 152315]